MSLFRKLNKSKLPGASVDAALVDGLAGDAGGGVEVGVADGVGIGVGDPGHLPLARAHVGRRHVDPGSQETLLRQLDSEPPAGKINK